MMQRGRNEDVTKMQRGRNENAMKIATINIAIINIAMNIAIMKIAMKIERVQTADFIAGVFAGAELLF